MVTFTHFGPSRTHASGNALNGYSTCCGIGREDAQGEKNGDVKIIFKSSSPPVTGGGDGSEGSALAHVDRKRACANSLRYRRSFYHGNS